MYCKVLDNKGSKSVVHIFIEFLYTAMYSFNHVLVYGGRGFQYYKSCHKLAFNLYFKI
jgi:hypothetical protein